MNSENIKPGTYEITEETVEWFEEEQEKYGTLTALRNLRFELATDLLESIGVVRTAVQYKDDEEKMKVEFVEE
jgi:hypothetical protein